MTGAGFPQTTIRGVDRPTDVASDIGQTKSQSGQPVTVANFRTDVNASGSVNASDIGLVKAHAGHSLP